MLIEDGYDFIENGRATTFLETLDVSDGFNLWQPVPLGSSWDYVFAYVLNRFDDVGLNPPWIDRVSVRKLGRPLFRFWFR